MNQAKSLREGNVSPRYKLDCSYWMRDAFRTATYGWKNICLNRRCRQLLNVSIKQRQFSCVPSRARCLLTSAVILTILNDLLTHFSTTNVFFTHIGSFEWSNQAFRKFYCQKIFKSFEP